MNYDIQPERELTEQEKLLAAVISTSQKIPCGFQIGMPLHLKRAMTLVEELFTKHNLRPKDELLRELQAWKEHAEAGLAFSRECDALMQQVIQSVNATIKH